MKFLSLKIKVALAATVISAVSLLLVGLIQTHFLRQDLKQVMSDQQFTLVTRVAQELDSKFAADIDLLEKSTQRFPVDLLDSPEAIRNYYHDRPGLFSPYDRLAVVALDGRVIVDIPEVQERSSSNLSDRPYFQKVIATQKPVIGDPVLGRAGGEPIVPIVVPIFDRNGKMAAVSLGVLRLYGKSFLSDLAAGKIGQTGYFFMLSKGAEPVFVVHPAKALMLQPRSAIPGLAQNDGTIRALRDGFEGTAEGVNSNGHDSLFSYKSLKTVNWVLVAVLPMEEAFAPIRQAQQRSWTIIFIASAVLLPLLWGLAWLLLHPLSALRKKIEHLRDSSAAYVPVLAERRDEVGVLARSFNALMKNLHETGSKHRQSEERLRTIADNLPAMIGYVDRDERYQFINQTWADWYGKVRDACIGTTVREQVGDAAYAEIGPRLRQALAGTPVTYQRDMVEVSIPRTLEASYFPAYGEDGSVHGCYIMIHDITDIKGAEVRQRAFNAELEDRVRARTSELVASNRELETFAYSVAHDFRTPLRAMDGYSALLQQEHAAQLDAEGKAYLGRIRMASARLATLIDDLLRLAQLTQRELKHEKVDLGAIADMVVRALRAGETGRSVEVHIEPGMTVRGDRALLTALLTELIGNAWKFSGRRLDAEIDIGSRAHEDGRAYFVRDNGVGFDMIYADKLFTPFQRLHGIADFPGSGVGLALASRIVERHGGRIWPESVQGEGATFLFTLPDPSMSHADTAAPAHLKAA